MKRRTWRERLRTLRTRRDDGASAVEYGLLVALIAVLIAAAVAGLQGAISGAFSEACGEIGGTECPGGPGPGPT